MRESSLVASLLDGPRTSGQCCGRFRAVYFKRRRGSGQCPTYNSVNLFEPQAAVAVGPTLRLREGAMRSACTCEELAEVEDHPG
jgi:hypothetical protein